MVSIKEFERRDRLAKGCNTFVTLIPKVQDPLTLNEYRPTSLVCSQYNIIAKALRGDSKL